MKLPNFLTKKIPKPAKIINFILSQSIEARRNRALLKHYEAGNILQVNNGKDNKKHFLSLETA